MHTFLPVGLCTPVESVRQSQRVGGGCFFLFFLYSVTVVKSVLF